MQNKVWKDLLNNITEEQVIQVLISLGSQYPREDSENNLVFQSVCHNSDSWKLCYYKETHNFFCYRDWEKYNIFTLVMKTKKIGFQEAFKYVCDILNISPNSSISLNEGFASTYSKEDWDIFNRFDKIQQDGYSKNKADDKINDNILKLYSDIYYTGWIDEHISIDSMKKYNIKYDQINNRIIIPHYDAENNLIGIRCRNLNPEVDAKYCPIIIEGTLYNHSLSSHFYGLNHNKSVIEKTKKVVIVESEKSVLQAESYFPDNNFVLACCGSNISYDQINILINLGVTEVILGMDWDFEKFDINDEKYQTYQKKILKLSQKLIPYFAVEVLLPPDNNFLYKCSPTDLGKEYLLHSMKKKEVIKAEIFEN